MWLFDIGWGQTDIRRHSLLHTQNLNQRVSLDIFTCFIYISLISCSCSSPVPSLLSNSQVQANLQKTVVVVELVDAACANGVFFGTQVKAIIMYSVSSAWLYLCSYLSIWEGIVKTDPSANQLVCNL